MKHYIAWANKGQRMDVRLARIAIVAYTSNDLAAIDFVSKLDRELCDVTQEKEHAVISFQNDE